MSDLKRIKPNAPVNTSLLQTAQSLVLRLAQAGYDVSTDDAITIWDHHKNNLAAKIKFGDGVSSIIDIFRFYGVVNHDTKSPLRINLVSSITLKVSKVADSYVLSERLRAMGYEISMFEAMDVWQAYSAYDINIEWNKPGDPEWRRPVNDSKLLRVFSAYTDMEQLESITA
jgi:hypothetical protein